PGLRGNARTPARVCTSVQLTLAIVPRAQPARSGRFVIDLAHQVEQACEVTELAVEIAIGAAVEVGAQGGDAGVAVEAQAVPHEVVRADEVGAEPDRGCD